MKENKNKLLRSRIVERIYLIGKLKFRDSFHIGSSESSLQTQKELLKDTAGAIFIPGSSIAGSIRSHLSQKYRSLSDVVEYYFGNTGKKEKQNSRVFVEDAYPEKNITFTTIRDGNAIARKYGSTQYRAKYDYEISPRETVFSLHIMLELREKDSHQEEIKSLFKKLVRDLEQENVLIGGLKTRGLGRSQLIDYQFKSVRFPEQLKTFLLKGIKDAPSILLESDSETYLEKVEDLIIEVPFNFENPLLVKDGFRSEPDEFIEETRWNKNKNEREVIYKEAESYFVKVVKSDGVEVPVIPGGSFKGIFRSRAEKIIRTLGGYACDPTDKQTNCSTKVYSSLKKLKEKPGFSLEAKEWLKKWYNTVCDNSCFTCSLFGHSHLASRVFFSDSEILNISSKKYDGVAINRFTGGAMDYHLFNAVPIIEGEGRLKILVKNPGPLEIVLIIFILRDLKCKILPLSFGWGKTKGFGLLEAGNILINGNGLHDFVKEKEAEGFFHQWKEKWENQHV